MVKCPECQAPVIEVFYMGDKEFTCGTHVRVDGEVTQRGIECRLTVAERTIKLLEGKVEILQMKHRKKTGRTGW